MITRASCLPRLLLLAVLLVFSAFASFAQEMHATNTIRFLAVDVFVDSQDQPLAAYQLEFTVTGGNAKIVGIEGGERAAFKVPPYYDPMAIQSERVILGAFSTEKEGALPRGRTRVATIHIQSEGDTVPQFEVKSATAADASGDKIKINTAVEPR